MARGRKALPAAVKRLRGNPGKRKIVPDKARPMAGAAQLTERDVSALPVPPPPSHMGSVAAAEWTRLAAQMVQLGTLRDLDRTTFEMRCMAYERLQQARGQLNGRLTYVAPNGAVRPHPLVKIIEAAEKTIRSFDTEFGLTPASRARVAHVTGEQPRQQQPALPGLDQPESEKAESAGPGGGSAPQPVSDDVFFAGPATRH